MEYRETKTEAISLANHKGRRLSIKPIKLETNTCG